MTAARSSAIGHPPKVNVKPVKEVKITSKQAKRFMGISDEQETYMKIWGTMPEYRKVSPGELVAPMFFEAAAADLSANQTVIDWGAGTGRGGYRIHQEKGLDVVFVDFAGNSLDENIADEIDGKRLRFVEHDITKPIMIRANWGYCCDVMEHLRPDQIDAALRNILECCDNAFFNIATGPDHFGTREEIGHPLHLTQRDYDWWLKKFAEHGVTVHRSAQLPGSVIFFVSGYGGFFLNRFSVNTEKEKLVANLRQNLDNGWQNLKVWQAQDRPAMILAGGPSLNEYKDEIIERRKNGDALITVNGAYNWCLENDIEPSVAMVLDAREFNTRFIRPVIDGCQYIVGSCCDPAMFDGLPKERTWLWHVHLEDEVVEVLIERFGEAYDGWTPIAGGSTVMLRALYTMKVLGLGVKSPLDIYGMDSCLMGESHHAYEQTENDRDAENVIGFTINKGKETEEEFACAPWMLSQAKEFIQCKRTILSDMDINVKGAWDSKRRGLLWYLLETGADLEE